MTTFTALAFAATNFIDTRKIFAAGKDCTVRTRYGTINGFFKNGVRTWLGIPYAQPPVGNLRWRAPEKLTPSDKTFDAKKFGFSPVQDHDEHEPASLLPQSEDCLTLNIWAHNSDTRKPVMVFVPGGAFINGGTGDPVYNGANLAKAHDVVVVTVNYRLNIFGFMNFSGIDSSFEGTGYLGLKDQVAALEWVKENIENFGGDPDNITLFGESAGASSVMFLAIAPAAHGLFQKAIAQSGHLSFYHAPDRSAKLAEEFMDVNDFDSMSELMTKSSTELEAAYEKFYLRRLFSSDVDYFPTCDGKFLPEHPFTALKGGAAKGIKFLTGNNADEYSYWQLYYKNYKNLIKEFHARVTPTLYEQDFSDKNAVYDAWQKNHTDIAKSERYLEFANQLDWRVGQELCAEYQSAFDTTYFYLFDQKSPVEGLGACHAIDLPFTFGNPLHEIEPKPNPQLVKQVQATWTSFAATGNPNNDLIPQWLPYSAADRQTMEINSKAWSCRKDFNTQNLDELRHIYEDNPMN